MNQQVVCIVDAYSTGAQLASEFKKYGYSAIHVQSSKKLPEFYLNSFRPNDFIDSFIYEGDYEDCISFLKKYNPAFVIAGTETGVVLADRLTDTFKLIGNSLETSYLRRNKFAMHEKLKSNGIPHVKQACCSNIEDALIWARHHGKWPVVAKPIDSAGTDNVFFCYNEEQLIHACKKILHNNNRLGFYNDNVLIQETLEGKQYFINAVSINGNHVITEIWIDGRKRLDGAGTVCDVEELLPYEGETQSKIIPYVISVLDSLDIKEGASHTEIIFTERGPILLETAARLVGSVFHEASVAATGDSHVTVTVERFVNPEKFKRRIGNGYPLYKNLFCVRLHSHESGFVVENTIEEKIRKLPSFFAVSSTPKPGEWIEQTINLFTHPGFIYLLHEDRAQIIKDINQIREWEKRKELFRVSSTVF